MQTLKNSLSHDGLLDALPVGVYVCDPSGRITFYNEAAAALWGTRPQIGETAFCGAWKLRRPDGHPLERDDFPMAIALREKRAIAGIEAVAERPDGTLVPVLAYPTPLLDKSGALIGGLNMLIDIAHHKSAETAADRLAAIIESSDDAIMSKDLDGIITSWNSGAEHLFGYSKAEVIGKLGTMLVPADRFDEEPAILARIQRGEHIAHYETIRRRRDGRLIEISLSVSPIVDRRGVVVGASKIARDITEKRRAEERKTLLLREMSHRVKNLFALASSLVYLSARSARSAAELAADTQRRFGALARAHALTLQNSEDFGDHERQPETTLHGLINTISAPYLDPSRERVTVSGPDTPVSGSAITSLALVLYELATNAAKYGALASREGHISIECAENDDRLQLTWREYGGKGGSENEPGYEGFGTLLARMTITSTFGGDFTREFGPEGLVVELSLPRERLAAA